MKTHWSLVFLGLALVSGGCRNMKRQPHARPLDPSTIFADGTSARTPPPHTVPAGPLLPSEVASGERQGQPLAQVPLPITLTLLQRGRVCYDAQCAPCHGQDGYGQGIVVHRGFPAPVSLHDPRLRAAPAGYFYQVMVQGYGAMYSVADRVAPTDRWAIVAFIRALQLSQHASLADVPVAQRTALALP